MMFQLFITYWLNVRLGFGGFIMQRGGENKSEGASDLVETWLPISDRTITKEMNTPLLPSPENKPCPVNLTWIASLNRTCFDNHQEKNLSLSNISFNSKWQEALLYAQKIFLFIYLFFFILLLIYSLVRP